MKKTKEKNLKTDGQTERHKYNPVQIELKWQAKWEKDKIYQPDLNSAKNEYYNLHMFPYPSAEGLHVGNVFAFAGADIYGRLKRMQGKDVFQPIGLDGFGIHSENYALKVGSHPMEQAEKSEKRFYEQVRSIGSGYDLSHILETYDPDYYKWTQWLFTELFKAGLAYRGSAKVNWCPSCKTVLADEQVIQKIKSQRSKIKNKEDFIGESIGVCERCGTEVEKRDMEQWFFKITDYADRLLEGLSRIDWTEKVKIAQHNWIGKSEGARIAFPLKRKYHVIILHAFRSGPESDFYPWLKEQLEKNGHMVTVPQLPHPTEPDIEEEQAPYLLDQCEFSEDTIIIGHSLGGVAALKLLPKLQTKIAKLVLVATPIGKDLIDGKLRPEYDVSNDWQFDYEAIKEKAASITVLQDNNDHIVPKYHGETLARELEAELIQTTANQPHFNSQFEPEVLQAVVPSLEVFTTRPDTLYGATFLVVSPEHPFVASLLNGELTIDNSQLAKVKDYVEKAKKKSEQERRESKEKTGVFSGAYVLNPVSNEQIPIWIADYVLMGYGTGAIMAVPGHDERDWEFAKKYNLPIRQVVMPVFGEKKSGAVKRDTVSVYMRRPSDGKIMLLKYKKYDWIVPIIGGMDEGESVEQASLREVEEETGLRVKFVRELGVLIASNFFAKHKKEYRERYDHPVLVELVDSQQRGEDKENQEMSFEWFEPKEVEQVVTYDNNKLAARLLLQENQSYAGPGMLIDSGEWDGLTVPEQIGKIIASVEKKGIGQKETTYHLRDWLISRQRYWGPPIPMIYCEECARKGDSWFTSDDAKKRGYESGIKSQESREKKNHNSYFMTHNSHGMAGWYPEENLPVLLPKIEDYRPLGTGKAPLANHPEFYKTTCPGCGKEARRETDVSDTFLDSSWYFLRYLASDLMHIPFPSTTWEKVSQISDLKSQMSNENEIRNLKLEISNSAKRVAWFPIDIYTGGAEHSVLHLLYARYIYKVLGDLGYIDQETAGDEPFPKFFAHGLIIKDGAKMSKSKGNVVVPDVYIKKYGADTLRMYLMFLGPFDQGGDFRDTGIAGMNRFLKRVWTLFTTKIIVSTEKDRPLSSTEAKLIKAVTEDIERFHYNRAIASIMTYYNYLGKQERLFLQSAETFLRLLAPFAPHISEELYQRLEVSRVAQVPRVPQGEVTKEDSRDTRGTHDTRGTFSSIHTSSWPKFDPYLAREEQIVIVIQVNGKLRGSLSVVNSGHAKSQIERLARGEESVKKHLEGKRVKNVIYVPGKILNFVLS